MDRRRLAGIGRRALRPASGLAEPVLPARAPAVHIAETLMGKKAELRFNYIQANAKFVEDVDV